MDTIKRHVKTYDPETKDLLMRLVAAGLTLVRIDNGEDQLEPKDYEDGVIDVDDAVCNATACDEAWIDVQNKEGQTATIYLVLGNDPGELVNDYHMRPEVDAVIKAHSERWDGTKQEMTYR